MQQILCSTGAIIGRPNGRDFTLLNECHKHLECDGYEFMMYESWYNQIDKIVTFMATFPAPIPVFHIEKQVGDLISRNHDGDTEQALKLFEINCTLAKDLGANKLVLHLWSGLDSDKDMPHNIKCYEYLRKIADTYGLSLTVENVVCNCADPMSHLLSLAKIYPDIQFTFDTKMAAFHHQIDLLYQPENRWIFSHIRHMHINDYKGGYKDWANLKTLHVEDGQIDFDRLFAFLKLMQYSGDFTVEATSFDANGVIDYGALNRSFRKIRKWIA